MRLATVVYPVFVTPPHWMIEAACRDADVNLFFPSPGNQSNREAVAYCQRCPVKAECLDYALQFPHRDLPGIWGGLNENQRNALRK